MAHAIESILPGGEDIEIIIVNDGSKDRTSEILMNIWKNTLLLLK